MDNALPSLIRRLEQLNQIGIALSGERDIQTLLEKILVAAKEITGSDAGTLYSVVEGRELQFSILRNDKLKLAQGGTTGAPIRLPNIPLYQADGRPNHRMVAAHAAVTGQTVNIQDAYTESGFDFTGTREFDARTGYRSQSFLTVPMRNHEGDIIGVLQLINALEPATGAIRAFDAEDQHLVESLASQAAVALTNRKLIEQLEDLFESFIDLINEAIDEKSPYTGGHCRRIPELAMMIADALDRQTSGPLASFKLSEQDRYELKIAAMLHDCGKITTPVHVVDKATKLETLFDRIHLVDTRFEILRRDAEIALLKARLEALENGNHQSLETAQRLYDDTLRQLEADRQFLHKANIGGEFMDADDQAEVDRIAVYTWQDHYGKSMPLLNGDEAANLKIAKGTLNDAERAIINNHIVVTIKMLEALPWPKHLKNVPEYAGGHHERMDGKGYPRGLRGDQMSVQARLLAVADIFEALTAADRPYKRGKTVSEALAIMGRMMLDRHIDPAIFDSFVRDKVYLRYAEEFLDPAQIDAVDESRIPGYTP
ncbi:HD-GYP domain-containing protein (c-di-GMP phosphodiesterase class II) [Sulfuritortus calidifontis]|uniref:HD-GYP domain-containing protein (C-di-GMP phosphodiesterase class II) n=1 Tax=Sulfuritortus calidifontis TaxID=1914471 RepID=A0A4R3JQL5_9PROT|nr:HD family phosphohydrolase [Sulfuritortus calidifontis]TCS69213.1 HD-GYP domain-containing protein (c-di-GMP phosphodiesterase class II) [Sulfuritortus calidifontis]